MKNYLLAVCLSGCSMILHAQEQQKLSSLTEQQLESLAETSDAEIKDDGLLQLLDDYRRHPLNLNEATSEQLHAFSLLTELQIQQLLSYRRLLGKLVNIYELQAVPGWDLAAIRRLLPFVTLSDEKLLPEHFREQWKGGDYSFLLRSGRVLEKAKGYDTPPAGNTAYYMGSRDKLFFRYKYNYKNTLQWGLLGDKDAGEPFFKGRQRAGFDFYSFHLFARLPGWIKTVAVGDFTVNMGQGLLQWQSLAFKKSADVLAIKRQSPVLRPYNSPGEYNFHRGIGITIQKNHWESTLLASFRKVDGTPVADSTGVNDSITALRTAGYHRTASENAARGIIRQTAFGGNISYQSGHWSAGLNAMHYNFSRPLDRADQPYLLFAFGGRTLGNAGMDYSYTGRNIHWFGEAAIDDALHRAFVQGALLSPAANVDVSLLYRHIDKDYRSLYSNAFTENTAPVNENGLYAGLSVRPAIGWQINGYADLFRFPWLKYRVDAPGAGRDYLLQITWTPDKQLEIYARYKEEQKPLNRSDTDAVTAIVSPVSKQDLRLQCNTTLNRQWSLLQRVELCWYDNNGPSAEQGFSAFTDARYQSSSGAWRGSLRLHYFETTGYNARIYALESDLPYHISVPALYDKGFRYYLNVAWEGARKARKTLRRSPHTTLGLRWAQTIYRDKTVVGSGLDAITGNRKTELTVQLMLNW